MRAGLTVAGIQVEVIAPQGPMEAVVVDRYTPFLGAVTDPVCTVELLDNGRERGGESQIIATLQGAGTDVVKVDHQDFTAELHLDGAGGAHICADHYSVDHLFRVLFGLLAPRNDALMLHACGVIAGGRSHVFAGRSGAGKSTLASMAGHRPLLSDEHVMVRREGNGWIGASTPFWGSYSRPGPARQAPLGGVWSLVQWPSNDITALEPGEAMGVLLGNAVLPGPEPELKAAVFTVAADLAGAVPASQLRFLPTPAVWEDIDDVAAA